jgi:hypothetical protein
MFWSGAFVVDISGGRAETPYWPGVPVPPGSKTRANRPPGPPGTWEVGSLQRHPQIGLGATDPKAPALRDAPVPGGSEEAGAALVSLGERNEPARRASEVGASS